MLRPNTKRKLTLHYLESLSHSVLCIKWMPTNLELLVPFYVILNVFHVYPLERCFYVSFLELAIGYSIFVDIHPLRVFPHISFEVR